MELSQDAIWNGALSLWQPARGQGYRFNLDPILLAGFCGPAEHVVDLGAGCGIIGLLLLGWAKASRVTAVELQPDLADLARKNAIDNGQDARFELIEHDLRTLELDSAVDAVVLNPPYFRQGQGRASPDSGRDRGRHERNGTLEDFVGAAARLLSPGGHLRAIVRWERGEELGTLALAAGLAACRTRIVRSRAGGNPRHLLFEAVRTDTTVGSTVQQEADLIVHRGADREFSNEVLTWVNGPGV